MPNPVRLLQKGRYALYRLGELTERDTVVAEWGRRVLLALDKATAGNEAPARTLLAELDKKRDPIWTGLLQAALGQRAKAIGTFEAALERQEASGGFLAIMLRNYHPNVLGPLRTDPRWEELMRTINVGWGLNPDGSLPE